MAQETDPSLNPLQQSTPPVPAIPLTPKELTELGLNEPLTSPQHSGGKIADFVERVKGPAAIAAAELHVPVEAVISQWALESGWGQSELAAKYNNLGGIKASHDWSGNRVTMPSYEKDRSVLENSPFRVYNSVDEYGKDFTNFLGHARYETVRGSPDVRSYGINLMKAGYAQDQPSEYSNSLVSISKRIAPFLNPK